MTSLRSFAVALIAPLMVSGVAMAQAQPPQGGGLRPPPGPCPVYKNPDIQSHIDKAYSLIGSDLPQEMIPAMFIVPRGAGLCSPDRVAQFNGLSNDETLPPAKAFDQLYYVGSRSIGSWILKTSQGLILFDSMNNAEDIANVVEPGMRQLGLDPSTIKYIVITHGHGDHWGGALTLQQKYGAQVWVGDRDVPLLARGRVPPPKVDKAVADGTLLTLGDTTVKLFVTPGHTPASVGAIFRVTDNGRPHKVGMFGGYGLPRTLEPDSATPPSNSGLLTYIRELERFKRAGEAEGVDVGISTHPFFDATIQKADLIARARPNISPWLMGREGWSRFTGASVEVAKTVESMIRERNAAK